MDYEVGSAELMNEIRGAPREYDEMRRVGITSHVDLGNKVIFMRADPRSRGRVNVQCHDQVFYVQRNEITYGLRCGWRAL